MSCRASARNSVDNVEVVYLPTNAMEEFMKDTGDYTVAVRVSVSRLSTASQVDLCGPLDCRASPW